MISKKRMRSSKKSTQKRAILSYHISISHLVKGWNKKSHNTWWVRGKMRRETVNNIYNFLISFNSISFLLKLFTFSFPFFVFSIHFIHQMFFFLSILLSQLFVSFFLFFLLSPIHFSCFAHRNYYVFYFLSSFPFSVVFWIELNKCLSCYFWCTVSFSSSICDIVSRIIMQ